MRLLVRLFALHAVFIANAFVLRSPMPRDYANKPTFKYLHLLPQGQHEEACRVRQKLFASQDSSSESPQPSQQQSPANGKSPGDSSSEAQRETEEPYYFITENTEQSIQEQYDKMQQLEGRVRELQQKQVGQEKMYKEQIDTIMEEAWKTEKDLLEKVRSYASQLDECRFDSQKALFAARDASKKKELQLKEQIRELRTKVNDIAWERNRSKEKAFELKGQRNDLRNELYELRAQYAKEINDWQSQYETQQNELQQLTERNRVLEEEGEAITQQKVREAERKHHEVEKRLRMKYSTQLAALEKQLMNCEMELKGKSERVQQLEIERKSLRTLMSLSVAIVSKRAKKRLTPFLRKQSKWFSLL